MPSTQDPFITFNRRSCWRLLAGLLTLTGVLAFQATAASATDNCDAGHTGCATLIQDNRWRSAWINTTEQTRSDCPANDVETHWKVRYRANSRNVDISYIQVWNLSDTRLSPGWATSSFTPAGQFRFERGTATLSKYKNSKIYGGPDIRAEEIWSPSDIAWGNGQLAISFGLSQADGHAFCGIGPVLLLNKR